VLHPLLKFQSVDLPESLPEIVVTPIKIGVTCNLCSRMWPIMGRIHQSCPYGILYDVEKQGFECAPALLLPSEHVVKPLALSSYIRFFKDFIDVSPEKLRCVELIRIHFHTHPQKMHVIGHEAVNWA